MNNQSTIKYGGIAFIISGLFYLVTFFTGGTVFYGIFGILATSLMAPSIMGLYRYYSQKDGSYKVILGTLALIVGAAFIVFLYWFSLVAVMSQDAIAQTSEEAQMNFDAFVGSITAISIMFGNIIFIGTFLMGLSSLKTGSDPKWMGWLAIVGSVVTLPWFFFAVMPPILQFIPAFGFLIVVIWMVAMGVRMYRI